MINDIDFAQLKNPVIQVLWEDTADNFTTDKIKSVKHYFQKKYNTTNVNVLTKVKTTQDDVEQSVDVTMNIMDVNYQVDLLKKYLKNKNYDDYTDKILQHNDLIEQKLKENEDEVTAFKKWYIKNIEFSNFLSYGENQKLDFDKLNGLVVIESSPSNFGGKCVRYNTLIDVEYDVDYIVDKLGFLPDELK